MEHRLEAQGTAGIDLLGFDGADGPVRPGQALDITLHWLAAAAPAANYKVSIQLLGADQRTVLAQEDSAPGQWTRPTKGWRQGEIVSDHHRLIMPSDVQPQRATVIVVLYDEDTSRRAEWLVADQLLESLRLCQLDVAR